MNTEHRCYVDVQAPDPYTESPPSTEIPSYLEL